MTTKPGKNVQLNVEEEHKPEPGLVLTQLQLMVVLIVLGRRLKLKHATHNLVQVNHNLYLVKIIISLR